MDKRDLNLQLCSDDPIFVGGVPIYPIPISEIAKIGYMRFNAEVRLLCLNESDISAMTGNDISDIGVFKYLVANAMRDQGLMDTILFWLSIITHRTMAEKHLITPDLLLLLEMVKSIRLREIHRALLALFLTVGV